MTDLEQSAMIEHHDMTAPTTRAGKALLDDPASGGVPGRTWQEGWAQTIAAIEAEARAEGAEAPLAALRALVAEADGMAPAHKTPECYLASGPYCGAHSFLEDSPLIGEARAILAATEDGGGA